MKSVDRMRERHAELLTRIQENRPEDNQRDLYKILNELSVEIKELSANDWDISSRTYICGTVVDVTISEGVNNNSDGHKKVIGTINDEQAANEIIILHNESRGALTSSLCCLEDASARLRTSDYEDAIAEIKDVLKRLAPSSCRSRAAWTMRLERGREAVYYCNSCDTEIDDNDIKYDPDVELDYCPHCDSTDVDYFPCEVSPEVNK